MAIDLGDIPSGTEPTTAEKLQIRKAIGVGTTDAPTFLAQTLTGQSLTGVQATSLVDLATTWNTSGTPTAIKLNVVETGINSNAASKLMDLQLSTVSKFRVGKGGNIFSGANAVTADGGTGVAGVSLEMLFANYGIGVDGNGNCQFLLNGTARSRVGFGVCVGSGQTFSFSDLQHTGLNSVPDVLLYRDAAPGILAQRNGTAKQALRVYNTALSGAPEWAEFDWITSGVGNTLRIGTNLSGTGAARPIDFVTGGVVRMSIAAAGGLTVAGAITATNLVTGNGLGGGSGLTFASQLRVMSSADGVMYVSNNGFTDFNRLQLGSTADTHPAIARDGAGIKFTGAAAGSTSWIKVPAVAVSALPSAATAGVGARSFVNDALAPTFGSAVASGGSAKVPVYSDGTNWNVG
jgi:hypothetical protein